ncbi:MAG TPA: peptidoglycan DD-metalloendopeptidase family protein [Polyangiaceae bacterium]
MEGPEADKHEAGEAPPSTGQESSADARPEAPAETSPAAEKAPTAEASPVVAPAVSPAESTGETPQASSFEPSVTVSQPERKPRSRIARIARLSRRVRIALAFVAGGAIAAAIGVPLTASSGAHEGSRLASAATVAGTIAGGDTAPADETSATPAGSVEAEPETAPRAAVWRVARLADDPGITMIDGAVARRPLLTALGAAGLPRSEAQRVVHSLEDVRDVDHFGPKDTFSVARDKATGRVVAYEITSSPTDVWQGKEEALGGGYQLLPRKLDLPSERVRIRKAFVVGTDLRASLTEAGLAPVEDVLSMLDDALEGHAELADIRPGARLRLVATQERVDGVFARWASLDAVEYFPATANAPSVRVYWDGDEHGEHGGKESGWYDAKGRQPYKGGWRAPVPATRIASHFNPHRMHPILHIVMPHNGIDFAAPAGAPVYATAAGTVLSVGPGGACGNMVQIAHAGGITSVYCHLSRFAAGVHAGQHVEARQLIAYVGQTGRATGPHLHFGIKKNGVFVDPLTLRLDGVRVIPRSKREEFDRARAQLDAELDAIPLPAQGAAGAAGAAAAPDVEPPETFYEEP